VFFLAWASLITFSKSFVINNNSNGSVGTRSILFAGGIMDFLNEGKKALVKSLAGDYDAEIIRTRIENLIADNSVLMLSFTT